MRLIIDQALIPVGGRRAQRAASGCSSAPREPVTLPAAMPARCLLLLLLGLLLPPEPACCQEARGSLQPWSQGVIAVVVFLVLVAIAFVVNRFWCKEKVENVETVVSVEDKQDAVISNGHDGRYLTAAADFRSKDSQHAYENTLELEEKVVTTAM